MNKDKIIEVIERRAHLDRIKLLARAVHATLFTANNYSHKIGESQDDELQVAYVAVLNAIHTLEDIASAQREQLRTDIDEVMDG